MINLPILNQEDIEHIHLATLQVLSEGGIILQHKQARSLLQDHGANIQGDRVLIPQSLVMDCLSMVPSKISLQGRDPEKAINLGDGACYVHNVGGVPNFFEGINNERRKAIRNDNIQATRLLDASPNVSSITPLFTPQDVPGEEMTLWMVYDTLLNTTKPFRAPGMQTGAEVDALAEMVQIVCPEGAITVGISPVSPLGFPGDTVDAIMAVSRRNLILGPLPCPILGATAPMSIAGGLVQQNAEILASLVIAQLVRPGLPIIYKGRLSVMDPRTGLSVWGNPEIGLISGATVQIGHFYNIPVDVYGFSTNSHTLDIQNGYERAINALTPMLAGADEISGIGELEGGLSSSFTQIVVDDEIISGLHRIHSGFLVNDHSLAVNTINSVLEDTRNFLGEKHTIHYLRSGEVLTPRLAVRDTWTQWDQGERKSILEHAEEKTAEILQTHSIPPLVESQIIELK